VFPGDQLVLNIALKRSMRGIDMYQCKALVDGAVVAEAEMMCSAQDRNL
jgi:3-hydroxyacyl-[acyl-carrier-protein] dehydratase